LEGYDLLAKREYSDDSGEKVWALGVMTIQPGYARADLREDNSPCLAVKLKRLLKGRATMRPR